MSMALKAVFERDLALAYRQRSELMQPMMFFILVNVAQKRYILRRFMKKWTAELWLRPVIIRWITMA